MRSNFPGCGSARLVGVERCGVRTATNAVYSAVVGRVDGGAGWKLERVRDWGGGE